MTWTSWQIDYLLFLQSIREATNGVLDKFFLNISDLAITPFALLFICAIYWGFNKKAGMYLISCFCFSELINWFLKNTACIYRPWILDSRVTPPDIALPTADGYSFPSGHTAGGMALWGGIATFWWEHKILRYCCFGLVLLIMFSRNYLGVHTPQDVIVSFVLGIGILYLLKRTFKWLEEGKNRDLAILGIMAVLCAAIASYIWIKSYPVDYNAQGEILYNATSTKLNSVAKIIGIFTIFFGLFFENRFIKFSIEECGIARRIIRIAIGLGLFKLVTTYSAAYIYSITQGFKAQCMENILTGLFITIIFPCLIKLSDLIIKAVRNKANPS